MGRRGVAAVVAVVVALALLMHVSPFSTGPGSGGSNPSATSPSNVGTSTTAGPGYPRLESLNGTIVSLGGDEVTRELWSRMRDYNASDSAVAVYVEWLRHALAEKPVHALTADPTPRVEYGYGVGYVVDDLGFEYWWVDAYGWRAEPPSMDGIVRIGMIRLGFGTALIVTAYQVGDHVDIVVHGTVINATEYKWTALYRALAMDGATYAPADIKQPNISVALFRIRLKGHGSYLEAGDGSRIRVGNVYVLVEMPIAISKREGYQLELSGPEYAGWMIIGRPALGLAVRLAYPPGADPLQLYRELVVQITKDLVTRGTYYMWKVPYIERVENVHNYETVLGHRNRGGWCENYAVATAHFASLALGAMTARFATPMPGHEMSLVLLPSSVFGRVETRAPDIDGLPGRGPIDTHVDVDKDNVTDAGVVLSNTDPKDYTLKIMDEILRETRKLGVIIGDMLSPYIYAMGFTEYVRSLPEWLTPPWYPLLKKVYERIETPPGQDALESWSLPYSFAYSQIALNKTPTSRVEPPSYKLALRNILGGIPVIDSGVETTPIKILGGGGTASGLVNLVVNAVWDGHGYRGNATVDNTSIVVIIHKTGTGEWVAEAWVNKEYAYGAPIGWSLKDEIVLYFTYKGTSYKITVRIAEKTTTTTINATIQLSPVYTNASTPWGQMPVFKEYVGTTMVNQTNITVVTNPSGVDEYSVTVFINGTRAYGETTGLPVTLVFSYGRVEYRLSIEPPKPPVLNQTLEPGLVPVDVMPVPMPSGTLVNITVYRVNETITIGNVTVVVFGYVSRLRIDIDVYVFGVPPGDYAVNTTGLEMNKTIEYTGALHVYLHYQAPENNGYPQLAPENTVAKITIQPLSLTVTIPVKG